MSTLATQFVTIVTFLLVFLIKIEGHSNSITISNDEVNKNSFTNAVVEEVGVNEKSPDCSTRPWICSTGTFPPRSVCCGNRCVDIAKDKNNCGLCGVNCPFNWKCCNRLCVNINLSPLNCGQCGRICPIGSFCQFGICVTTFVNLAPPPLL
ncbi:unnamed protein product [Lathyrus oleraceus]|uniref:stigma-specific STIG1-like protein 4 n=1 Tax=Pisum sativum TaxID=3888 RepID=UPI0021D125C6|nr:stigma-specific STIG1-like protein 4 [Pisum sativum]